MATALVWHDIKSFQQHLEDMRVFRRWHQNYRGPAPACGSRRSEAKGAGGITSDNGHSAIVPIWEITPPRNSQN